MSEKDVSAIKHNIVLTRSIRAKVQYYPNDSQQEILTKNVTAGQLKRLMNNGHANNFYLVRGENFVTYDRIETVTFSGYGARLKAVIEI